MDLTTFHSQFRDEAADNIRVLNEGLIALEAEDLGDDDRRVLLDAIFRAMHTIKGSARVLGFESISRIAHTCENILAAVREGQRSLDRPLADDLLRGGDAIMQLLNDMLEGRPPSVDVEALALTLGRSQHKEAAVEPALQPGAQPAASVPQPAPSAGDMPARQRSRAALRQTVRVRVDRLDRLLNLAGELSIGEQTQAAHLQAIDELRALAAAQQRSLIALHDELQRIRFSANERAAIDAWINSALNTGDQINRDLKTQVERFAQHTGHTAQLVDDLEREVMAARLLPVSTLFANLPRAVRELAHTSGKEVALTISGETTELDRKVIEALQDPLVHLLRNAVDHGIEPPAGREQAGKPRQGTIRIDARSFGSHVHIVIADDGRGIDPAALRQSAVRKGLLSDDAAARLTDQEALELIFIPGFSTAAMITDISGRGVGMDVVRTNLAEIGGQVQIDSHVGQGTTITLVLPLTLVTTRVLFVEVGRHLFALPATGCRASIWVRNEQVRTIEGRAMVSFEGRMAPLLRLADLVEINDVAPPQAQQRVPTVVIGSQQRPLALLVDRMIDEREVVVKPLGPLLERQRQYSGVIQLGDGRLVLLLNPAALAQLASGMAVADPLTRQANGQRRARLLVADDSFTTRELIRSILQSAGYQVTTAFDGLDALDKLRDGAYDLVVSDVEMPRIDGFQLTARIRSELGQAHLPVIIVTSLASELHRRRGLEVGAQAYIVKSQFDQSNLLETIQQLLGHEHVPAA